MGLESAAYQHDSSGYAFAVVIRRVSVFVGIVAVVVGLFGLVTPVRVSPELEVVQCGSALSHDLSSARAHDDRSADDNSIAGRVVIDTNYTELCRKDLEDRRLWTVTLMALGFVLLTAAIGSGMLLHRRQSQRNASH